MKGQEAASYSQIGGVYVIDKEHPLGFYKHSKLHSHKHNHHSNICLETKIGTLCITFTLDFLNRT